MAGETTIRHGKASIRIEGLEELFARLGRLGADVKAVGKDVFNAGVERVYAKSQAIVPVDPEDGGELRESGRMSKARVSKADVVTASVSYGAPQLARLAPGQNPIYAIVQHEDLSARHTHGEAKFLERPFLAEKENVLEDLRARIAAKIGAS